MRTAILHAPSTVLVAGAGVVVGDGAGWSVGGILGEKRRAAAYAARRKQEPVHEDPLAVIVRVVG